nr:MAG TPA: hypothetical protein [Caudoviricetes sp.]
MLAQHVYRGLMLHKVIFQQLFAQGLKIVISQRHGGAGVVPVVTTCSSLVLPPVGCGAGHAQFFTGRLHGQALVNVEAAQLRALFFCVCQGCPLSRRGAVAHPRLDAFDEQRDTHTDGRAADCADDGRLFFNVPQPYIHVVQPLGDTALKLIEPGILPGHVVFNAVQLAVNAAQQHHFVFFERHLAHSPSLFCKKSIKAWYRWRSSAQLLALTAWLSQASRKVMPASWAQVASVGAEVPAVPQAPVVVCAPVRAPFHTRTAAKVR